MSSTSTSLPIATPDLSTCTLATCPVILSKIGYIPNLAGNAFIVAWFSLMLLAQIVLSIRYKTWSYLAGQFFGLILEIIGYTARVKLHDTPFSDGEVMDGIWVGGIRGDDCLVFSFALNDLLVALHKFSLSNNSDSTNKLAEWQRYNYGYHKLQCKVLLKKSHILRLKTQIISLKLRLLYTGTRP